MMMIIMTPTMLNTSYIDQNAVESNSHVSTSVLLFQFFSTRYISVIKAQNLCYLHQYIIIIFQNSV